MFRRHDQHINPPTPSQGHRARRPAYRGGSAFLAALLAVVLLAAPLHAACGCCVTKALAALDTPESGVCCTTAQAEIAPSTCCAETAPNENAAPCAMHLRDAVESCHCGATPASLPTAAQLTTAPSRDDHRPLSSDLDAAAFTFACSIQAAPAAFARSTQRATIPHPPYYLANCVLLA